MPRITIEDLPLDMHVTERELRNVGGGMTHRAVAVLPDNECKEEPEIEYFFTADEIGECKA